MTNPFDAPVDPALCAAWFEAAGTGAGEALEDIYEQLRLPDDGSGPVCTGSGRCCQFERFDHRLFTTGLEAAFTLANLPNDVRFDEDSLGAAIGMGTCPFLVEKMCVAHGVKPGACRVFYCDATRTSQILDRGEEVVRSVRAIHDRFDVAYRYASWETLLRSFVQSFTQPPQTSVRQSGAARPASLNDPTRIGLRVLRAEHGSRLPDPQPRPQHGPAQDGA